MSEAGVPTSIEELHDRYDRLITWAIRRSSRVRLDPDQLQDFRQQVYLRVMERDYLERCRKYYETHEGNFSTSLFTLVRNVVITRRRRSTRDPLALRQIPYAGSRSEEVRLELDLLDQHATAPSPAGPVEARNTLDVIAKRLKSRRRRTPIRKILDAAVVHGLHSKTLAAATGADASTVRHYLVAIRAEARRLESPCTAATKSEGTPLPLDAPLSTR